MLIQDIVEHQAERPVGLFLTVYIDGASRGNPGPGGAAVAIYNGDRIIAEKCESLGRCTNNQAEYRALLLALRESLKLRPSSIVVRTDSQLLARQMSGRYKVKNKNILPLFKQAKELASQFQKFRVEEIPRSENRYADKLASNAASVNHLHIQEKAIKD